MRDRRTEPDSPTPRDGVSWVPVECTHHLRTLLRRHLDGERYHVSEVGRLASALARAARANDLPSERLLIAIRALWRDLALSHADRLQAAGLYDDIVRQSIEQYYME